jgi:probable rRNA maturation factor
MIKIIDDHSILDDVQGFLEKLKSIERELELKGDITIKIGSEEEAVALNQSFGKQDYIPDVLSFPMKEDLPEGFYLGDIFICSAQAEKQAAEQNHPLNRELLVLMIHGILHLAGYDHEKDDSPRMQQLQDELLAKAL